jgi:hypothetical protein
MSSFGTRRQRRQVDVVQQPIIANCLCAHRGIESLDPTGRFACVLTWAGTMTARCATATATINHPASAAVLLTALHPAAVAEGLDIGDVARFWPSG